MIRSRVGALLVMLALLGAVLIARLFQVQVHEHEVWSAEAARLVHSGREIHYRRGRVLDARGRVLVQDEDRRAVVLIYRDFRREHPLGQVAHARSLLAGRPIDLAETRAHLVPWAKELLALKPHDLRALALGGDEDAGHAADDDVGNRNARRAADLAFYLRQLLALDAPGQPPRRWNRLVALARENGGIPFLELAARVRNDGRPSATAEEERRLEERLTRSMDGLATLARWLDFEVPEGDLREPIDLLIEELERARRSVEDATAAKLFAEATGFAPGRLAEDTLLECIDHTWIAELLGWDAQRLAEWAHTVRTGWQSGWRDGVCVPRLLWDLVLDPKSDGGSFLDRMTVVFEPEGALERSLVDGPTPWYEVSELAVFSGLDEMFEARASDEALRLTGEALPVTLESLRKPPDALRLLPPGSGAESFRSRLERSLERRRQTAVETLTGLSAELIEAWDLRYQEVLRRALDEMVRAAAPDERGPSGGLLLAEEGRDRAAERAEYFLKDYGQRARPLSRGELTYDPVYLLTRREADFPGFQVRDLRAREACAQPGDDALPAHELLGLVSAPSLEQRMRQRDDAARLRDLEGRRDRDEEEEEELRRLIGAVRLEDEVRGVSGIEAFFEPELSGTNGFAETRGLQDVFGAGGEEIAVRDPVDGEDVVLTLDVALQTAAQRSLREPAEGDEKSDERWRANPVGAIVLLSGDGDVLAAASEPDDQSWIAPEAEGQRLLALERTLRKPTFQPPGSVFKPYVAAWALDHGLDPEHVVVCGPIARGGCGYKDLRCWNTAGHGPVRLEEALERSCNAYFAWLGETLSTEDFRELMQTFGFGQPTGLRRLPPWDDGLVRRGGLFEDVGGLAIGREGELSETLRRMAGNGLAVVEATPMQLARATLALATGENRELRIAQRIGEREFPPSARVPLAISRKSLDFVRAALRRVASAPLGTAHAALAPGELGFEVAVKTGSADLENRTDDEGHSIVQKHAWVSGWLPPEHPQLVFVVFQHGTSATSSHGAIYLARQVLLQPEVLSWLADRAVDVSGVAAR